MRTITLGLQPEEYKAEINKRILFCVIACIITIILHGITVLLYSEHNHTILLVLNILADIGCCTFLLAFSDFYIRPFKKMYLLSTKERTKTTGAISHISSDTIRYMGLDCYEIIIENYKYFLPADTVTLQEHETITFYATSHVIMEVLQ